MNNEETWQNHIHNLIISNKDAPSYSFNMDLCGVWQTTRIYWATNMDNEDVVHHANSSKPTNGTKLFWCIYLFYIRATVTWHSLQSILTSYVAILIGANIKPYK